MAGPSSQSAASSVLPHGGEGSMFHELQNVLSKKSVRISDERKNLSSLEERVVAAARARSRSTWAAPQQRTSTPPEAAALAASAEAARIVERHRRAAEPTTVDCMTTVPIPTMQIWVREPKRRRPRRGIAGPWWM